MKKSVLAALVLVAILFMPSMSYADCSGSHSSHSLFCPKSGFNLFGAAYNPTTENWGWYVGARTAFFHPTRWLWVSGLGFGVAFDQSSVDGRGPVLIPTFVPLQIGDLSLEVSINQVRSKDNNGIKRYSRLVVLAWSWRF